MSKTSVRILGTVAVLLVLLLVAIGIQEITYLRSGSDALKIAEYRLTRDLPEYEKIQRSYSTLDAFRTREPKKDAAEFLNVRVLWIRSGGTRFYLPSTQPRSPIPYSQALSSKLEWSQIKSFDFQPFDFSALRQIADYDHWDITGALPVQENLDLLTLGLLSEGEFFKTLPRPVFDDLVQLARLRLMRGIQNRDLPTALKEVRHLAMLCYSTETFAGGRAAGEILKTEAEAYDFATKAGLLRTDAWAPVPDPERLKTATWLPASYYGLHSPEPVMKQSIGVGQNSMMRCISIANGTALIARMRPYLEGSFPFERNFVSLSALKEFATDPANGCRLPIVKAYWEGSLASSKHSEDPFWMRIARPFPYLRRAAALKLLSNAIHGKPI